jgi:DNA-3-methyladenine glycosylase II
MKSRTMNPALNRHRFYLEPKAPFRLDLAVWALRRRPENEIDRWDGATYRRVLVVECEPVEIVVTQVGPPDSPRLRVTFTGGRNISNTKKAVASVLSKMLSLQADLSPFARFANRKAKLGPLVRRFRGMRPPRFPSVFEALVNGIACQQMSLTVGIILLSRLARRCGASLKIDGKTVYAFPRPRDLAHRDPESVRRLGFSRQKARAIIEAARTIVDGTIDLEILVEFSDEAALAELQKLRGVGRWTAEYILLRGLGRWHIFPGDDVGARNNLSRWLGLTGIVDYERVSRALSRWKPYGGLIYFHLLLDRLAEKGHVKVSTSTFVKNQIGTV